MTAQHQREEVPDELPRQDGAPDGRRLPYLDLQDSSNEHIPFIRPSSESASHQGDASPPLHPTETSTDPIESRYNEKPATASPVWKIWWLEGVFLLFGIAMFALIVVVLAQFDQQDLPNWPMNITLNTFLALSTMLSKAAVLVPVSIAISQVKWTWFLKERPLDDFSLLDQSSRGPWGSLLLLWRVKFRHFVSLGALLMITGFLTSPVSQLAIRYPVRDVIAPGETATAKAASAIAARGAGLRPGTVLALRMAVSDDTTNYTMPIVPLGALCSTGNCTFDKYHSLGVCMKTTNITSHLQIEKVDNPPEGTLLTGDDNVGESFTDPEQPLWNVSLPGGYRIVHQSSVVLFTDMLYGNNSFGFADDANLLETRVASVIIIYTTPTEVVDVPDVPGNSSFRDVISGFRHEAHEMLYHLCVQTYETKVEAGVEHTRMVSELAVPAEPTGEIFFNLDCGVLLGGKVYYPCKPNPSRWADILRLDSPAIEAGETRKDPEEGFSITYGSIESMVFKMKPGMEGFGRALPRGVTQVAGGDFPTTIFDEALLDPSDMTNSTHHHSRISNVYMNVAVALSSMMRGNLPKASTDGSYIVIGNALKEASYVDISWGWISYLASEIAFATLFVAIAIVRSRRGDGRLQDLKGSSLAPLTVLSAETRAMMGDGTQPVDELESTARRLRVRLRGTELVPVEIVGKAMSSSRSLS
ncbi:uncharacterized protein DNG_07286 [Cephalotrichum gorgonifer]|uniref:Uncharacterized protein n=1 Tax=Cephalotrichum gorgonifer TaxID=2041049 RepID=A0AAE8N1D6_9PEZI|nr:uncharacterized protein DNG_07286 [Cephalotrichum gorgonifer]